MNRSKAVGALFALLVVCAAIAFFAWPLAAPGGPTPTPNDAPSAPGLARSDLPAAETTTVARAAAEHERNKINPITDPAAASGLVVTVRHAKSDDLAENVAIYVRRRTEDTLTAQRAVTDASGVARFELEPGTVIVWDNRFGTTRRVEIVDQGTTRLDWTLPGQMNLRGTVTDPEGQPIAGAQISISIPGLVGRLPQVVATTLADGTYEARSLSSLLSVDARAHGFVASAAEIAHAQFDVDQIADFVLQPLGGSVAGQVVDALGTPVEGALVCIGDAPLIRVATMDPRKVPALARTDGDGRFVAVGLEPGEHPAWARAPHHAIWRGTAAVASHGTTEVRIQLEAGCTLTGVVRNGTGDPIPDAEVEVGGWFDPEHCRVLTNGDGRYELPGIAPGNATVTATHDDHGKVERRVDVPTDPRLDLDLVLSKGLRLVGRVIDGRGDGVAEVRVKAQAPRTVERKHFYGTVSTDDEGRFAIDNCPEGRVLQVSLSGDAIEPRSIDRVDATLGEREFVVQRALTPASIISGTVVDPQGLPLSGAKVSVWSEDGSHRPPRATTDARGAFSIGPVPHGPWTGSVEADGYPGTRIGPRTLAPGERWDLGPVTLVAGGHAIIEAEGDDVTQMGFMLRRPSSGARWVPMPKNGVVRTPMLEPDRYELRAWGPKTPAQLVHVDIVAERSTTVRLRTADGVLQRFAFETADGRLPPSGGQLTVFDGDTQLVDVWLEAARDAPWTYELALLPGTYRARLRGPAIEGEESFTVGSSQGPTVTVRGQ